MIWDKKLVQIEPIKDLTKLPYYGHQFVLRNLGRYKKPFLWLTLVRVTATLSGFGFTYLISHIITTFEDLHLNDLLYFYFPIIIIIKVTVEILDYFTRRYGEAFPAVFGDITFLRFYKTVLNSNFHYLINYSKEKLHTIISKYMGSVNDFIHQWIWQIPNVLVSLVIIITILFIQNPFILLLNIIFFFLFLSFSLNLSKKLSVLTQQQSDASIKTESIKKSFALQLNTVERLLLGKFMEDVLTSNIQKNWKKYKEVRDFHARRWFLQLNVFNLLYYFSLFFGIYQVIQGSLPVGFLLLIHWSYGYLWGSMVFIIEYYVKLMNQKENAKIANREFKKILVPKNLGQKVLPDDWDEISVKKTSCKFKKEKGTKVSINIPSFTVKNGEKIGIIGKSGSGKTTLFHILLGIIQYKGKVEIDNIDIREFKLTNDKITVINNDDTLFNISIKDNILAGSKASKSDFKKIVDGTHVSEFIKDYKIRIGDPGTNFSAGQMQRLRLARGLIQDSQIYLLDEPFNGIDEKTRNSIMKFLKEFMKDKTVIIISHHKEELDFVDKYYEMKGHTLHPVKA